MENSPEKDITLKLATIADIERYIEMEQKVVSKLYSALVIPEEVIKEMKKGPVYMIMERDTVVGSVSYYKKEDQSIYISGLVIDPDYQGRGIARKVMLQILSEIKGEPRVKLVTHPDNIRAVNLYESLGFKITDRKENYFGDGEPRIELTLNK